MKVAKLPNLKDENGILLYFYMLFFICSLNTRSCFISWFLCSTDHVLILVLYHGFLNHGFFVQLIMF
ncbi:hypothetical protein HanIR_Chr15g0734691 [Helianthus annuus]|nr:hypothetical protein HanIR_Chr15g0734691 [Helianthus annuus]